LRMPLSATMLCLPGLTVVYCSDDSDREPLEAAGTLVCALPGSDGRPDLAAVLADLAAREVNDVLVEAGPILAGALLVTGLVDELVLYIGPHLMGGETNRMFETPGWTALSNRRPVRITDRRQVGSDLRITAQLEY
jgi:diaminohydroxyphosphoribosylaminopyrimidine deaminase / 5-amino-6-(5-phosphoribosylamino)uracil reductase